MDDLERRPDDPDAIDRDPSGKPDPGSPDPDRDAAEDADTMRFPGAEDEPDVIGSGTDAVPGDEPESFDADPSGSESL
jgi:hypothetical protein